MSYLARSPFSLDRPSTKIVGVSLALLLMLNACQGSRARSDAAFSYGLHSINGTELFVNQIGQGDPIIVVHGGPVLEHGYLYLHLAPLAESHRLIFYDQRLSGRSAGSADRSSIRIATFVDDIEALRESLGLDRVHLLAHSWGGLLAMNYAIRHGEHLESLILLDSMAASSSLWQQEGAVMAERITEADLLEQQTIRESEAFGRLEPAAIEQMLLATFKPQFHDRSRIADLHLYVPEDYTARSQLFGNMMVDLQAFDLHDELGSVLTPSLIVYGSDEPSVDLGGSALHAALQNSRLEIIENAGHFPFIEQPGEFLRVVRQFLAEIRRGN